MSLTERDKKHIWHPLTQHKTHPNALPLTKAQGALLYGEDGRAYIDGIASWYTCMYGHCNPYILKEVQQQMQQMDQVIFSGFTHKPAIELSEKLIELLPNNQQKIFFSDNGSTATEIGIKMALQYHFNLGNDRDTILAFEEGFHGDTFGAMSASSLSVYNGPFEKHFINVVRIPLPTLENYEQVIQQLNKILEKHKIAGFIYEPLVQGAAGMKFYTPEHLNNIVAICKANGVICIADEVMTGFGKTGTIFASEQVATKPDVICISKALTAGLVPMAVTSCTQKIYNAFYSDIQGKGLFHAHTYTANPIACSAALAGIQLLQSEEIAQKREQLTNAHLKFADQLSKSKKVKNVRVKGAILAFELNIPMERYGSLRDKLYSFFMAKGVFIRPLGNTIYVLPPYIITLEQLTKIYDTLLACLSKDWK